MSFFSDVLGIGVPPLQKEVEADPIIIEYDFTNIGSRHALFMVAAYSSLYDRLYIIPKDIFKEIIKSELRGMWKFHYAKNGELIKVVAPSGPRVFWEKN